MKTFVQKNDLENTTDFTVQMDMHEHMLNSKYFYEAILKEVAKLISEEIIKQHLPEVLEKISPEAIANMTIAETGAKIRETLEKKIPDKILNVETKRTEIYQKGLFGGLKKL